jgi:double-stranded uracil-DNA glycosylase
LVVTARSHSLEARRRPTREELQAAAGKTVPDVIAPALRVLFCGINPGLYTAAVGHHFARPGNRFWPALHAAGFTDRLLSPYEEADLLQWGYGITNLVERATAAANEIGREEYREGAHRLETKARRYHPGMIAILGLEAYRRAFDRPRAGLGEQPERLGPARLWVLPNPSGLNAHYQAGDFARLFRELRSAAEA